MYHFSRTGHAFMQSQTYPWTMAEFSFAPVSTGVRGSCNDTSNVSVLCSIQCARCRNFVFRKFNQNSVDKKQG